MKLHINIENFNEKNRFELSYWWSVFRIRWWSRVKENPPLYVFWRIYGQMWLFDHFVKHRTNFDHFRSLWGVTCPNRVLSNESSPDLAPIFVLNFESRIESRPGQNQDLCQDLFYIFYLCSWFSRSFESSLDPTWIFIIFIRPWTKSSAILPNRYGFWIVRIFNVMTVIPTNFRHI